MVQAHYEKATLGGGCFWCLEALFQTIKGVTHVVSGYAGGQTLDPDYEQVCQGGSGHAEVVQITFDTRLISYAQILELFWAMHDPTTLNRQGNDVGTQYRSIILYHDEAQYACAKASMQAAAPCFSQPITTELKALERFYPAEAYHQNYFAQHPMQGYCRVVIAPKVAHFKKEFDNRMA